MNYQTTYRKGLAVSLLLLIFAIDLAAVHLLFPSYVQLALFGAILGVQTLLILAYHQRCLECEGCMEKASAGIYLFYKVFAAIGFFSMLLILLAEVLPFESHYLKIAVAITYAALLLTGVSTAFRAIIGVRNFSDCHGNHATSTAPDVDSDADEDTIQKQLLDETKQREQETLNGWQEEEAAKRAASIEKQLQQSRQRKAARFRAQNTGTFKPPHLPNNFH